MWKYWFEFKVTFNNVFRNIFFILQGYFPNSKIWLDISTTFQGSCFCKVKEALNFFELKCILLKLILKQNAISKWRCFLNLHLSFPFHFINLMWFVFVYRYNMLHSLSQSLASLESIPEIWRTTGRPCIPRIIFSFQVKYYYYFLHPLEHFPNLAAFKPWNLLSPK